MAEIAVGALGSAFAVLQWVVAPVKRQLSYLCCFTGNVAALEVEAQNLVYQTGILQARVDTDKNNGRGEIYEIVERWFIDSGDITRTKERILAEVTEVGLGNGCFNYAKRVSLTKEALKTTEAMKELIDRCKFDSVSRSPPIAASSVVPFGKDICEFNSRKRFEEDIMKNLNVDKIGIWGIGGVGKTVMAQKILNRALDEGLFHEVVMVTVSQPVDKLGIQKKIAEQLGLTTLKDKETLEGRAHTLRTRLRQKQRSLILLDDVWEVLNLKELGIPCDGGWCTIILTSRNNDILKGMKVKNVCELGVLDEDEAWDFFKKMAGTCVEDAILKPIAYEVMKECKGLLVALESVGKAHEDEKSRDVWRDSLRQLRKHNPVDIPNVIEEVYKPLKLSYDRLENKNAKSLFLLCCLFDEDADIPLEYLTYFAIGLRLFDDMLELEEMRGRIRRLIVKLRNRCLLLESSKEDCVRMHDVVRDVSIYIAVEERRVNCSDCTWISSYTGGGASSKLELLWLKREGEERIGKLIEGSTKLNVLFIELGLLMSLPLHTPRSLKTLVLHGCESLESIEVVEQLESLEIFICFNLKIKELPKQLKGLKRLKRLVISECDGLDRIAAGVISSLEGLEELEVDYFNKWEGSEIENGNARLREIESLKKLRLLNIKVRDIALAVQPLRLSSKLVQFRVMIGEDLPDYLTEQSYQRSTYLNLGNESDGIDLGYLSENIFLTRTEYLLVAIVDKRDFNLSLASAQSIRGLTLKGFTNKKNLSSVVVAFSLLEFLFLDCLFNLEEMWDAPIPSNSFNILKHLKLHNLQKLKQMGKIVSSAANDFFLQLETIEIMNCFEMEHLLLLTPNEEEVQGNDNHIGIILTFPKLKKLVLSTLQKLTSICSRGIESIQFPLLAQMDISDCDNLKWLVTGDVDDNHCQDVDGDDDSSHLFCHPKVSFPNLTELSLGWTEVKDVWCDRIPDAFLRGLVELRVDRCGKIKRLFSSSSKIPQNLINLQKLEISWCKLMVKVIEDEEDESSCDHTTQHIVLFPSLQYLKLGYLHELESFCEWSCALELPSLKRLDIWKCHEMKSFSAAGSFITTATISVDGRVWKYEDDLNDALQQKIQEAKMKWEEGVEERIKRKWRRT